MKYHSTLIIVADIDASKQFYTDILQEEIQLDLGNYVVLSGFSMMSRAQWNKLTNDAQQENAGHSFELYFEEDQIDAFARKLETRPDARIFNPLEAAPWGQRAIRFLDPDGYVIEVSESMEATVKRMLSSGMTVQEASKKSLMPVPFVEKCQAEIEQQ